MDRTDHVGPGSVINALAFISTIFDLDAGPPEYGEVVGKAEVTSPKALVLTVPSDEFKKRIEQYVDGQARKAKKENGGAAPDPATLPDPLARMRELAMQRVRMLTVCVYELKPPHIIPSTLPLAMRGVPSSSYLPWCHVAGGRSCGDRGDARHVCGDALAAALEQWADRRGRWRGERPV